jgi:signal peptidase II
LGKYGTILANYLAEVYQLKKYIRAYLVLALFSGLIIALDQYTKWLVRSNLQMWTDSWAPWDWLMPYARIVHVPNTGVAFGMFQGLGNLFAVLIIIVSLVIIYIYPRVPESDWSLRLAMGFQLSGAVGNLIDRLTIGHVTDFISVGNFAVFNVADSSVVVGTFILILGVWIQERNEKKNNANSPDGEMRSTSTGSMNVSEDYEQ